MNLFRGTIVEESLLDNRQLNEFRILRIRITNAEDPADRWHLYFVEASQNQIEKLAENLKPARWYAHFWRGDEVTAIFPQKSFTFQYSQPQTWRDAVEYGVTLGIPEEQLDFLREEL